MKKHGFDYLFTVAGPLLFAAGLLLLKILTEPQGLLRTLPYLLIAVGCGSFGHGMGNILSRKAGRSNPKLYKQLEIAAKDERNLLIACRAKAKAFDLMLYVFGALVVVLSLMNIDMAVSFLLIFAYVAIIAYYIYYQSKYNREM